MTPSPAVVGGILTAICFSVLSAGAIGYAIVQRKKHESLAFWKESSWFRMQSPEAFDTNQYLLLDGQHRFQNVKCIVNSNHSNNQLCSIEISEVKKAIHLWLNSTDSIPLTLKLERIKSFERVGEIDSKLLQIHSDIQAEMKTEITEQQSIQLEFSSAALCRLFYETTLGLDKRYRPRPLRIQVLTYNTGGQSVPTEKESLKKVIPEKFTEFDLIALGFQEVSTNGKTWATELEKLLQESSVKYTCIHSAQSWDRTLLVFIRSEYAFAVRNTHSKEAYVGAVNSLMGNKGGLAFRCEVFGTTIAFVNSHLAAHQEEIERRNADYSNIIRKLSEWQGGSVSSDLLGTATPTHVLIWIGDLNYRIDQDRESCLEKISKKDWTALLAQDQLLKQIANEKAFVGFHEAPITFPPTYKLRKNVFEYSENRARVPSWCDRVLIQSVPGIETSIDDYNALLDTPGSDHRPVYAAITVNPPYGLSQRSEISRVVKPFVPTERGTFVLKFKHLEARDLLSSDVQGLADPYCEFFSDAFWTLDRSVRISTKSNTLCATWTDSELPNVSLWDQDIEVVKSKYVTVQIKDEDTFKSDDFLGRAVIWLGGPSKFDVRIMHFGVPAGRLLGEFTIEEVYPEMNRKESTFSKSASNLKSMLYRSLESFNSIPKTD
mmetsp:Transcript_13319/g.23921  ORF Transcript_13319/g.23921 Transcript_13319/m.23921 type:complete len:660 (-) Transcript_13319:87-2066(-)|eukprot:CAMPEP_0182446824 /NCGR_PEP_ID=MMETSP1172-20130603/6970_1 /TAXON_ID=708627 /ORGANISM="Timspurckia oligopyrenoides, Strain CCMP3278" /LENGTH=659 /DNA_ID=CAMNT_0024642949 /DNA_START=61 /DNA_END=2040 /DNA_ORIENTATION=+